MPWHILAPRAVACDNLHLRASAHLWHVSAFLCNREFLRISCYKKIGTAAVPAIPKGSMESINFLGGPVGVTSDRYEYEKALCVQV